MGGLGNRENDAIVYFAVGLPASKIFNIDDQSKVRKLDQMKPLSYKQMCAELEDYFP